MEKYSPLKDLAPRDEVSRAIYEEMHQRGDNYVYLDISNYSEVDIKERFDIVFCFHSFPHFRDKIKALLNIRNLLNPNGTLIVLHLSGSKQLNEFHKNIGGAVSGDSLPDAEEWKILFEKTNFNPIEIEDKPDLFLLRAKINNR
jgi:SAM-dependent methyltransferase